MQRYSVIETRIHNDKPTRLIFRHGLTLEKAKKIKFMRDYANKHLKRDWTVEVVEEYASNRFHGMGKSSREREAEVHPGRESIHTEEDKDIRS